MERGEAPADDEVDAAVAGGAQNTFFRAARGLVGLGERRTVDQF